MARYFEAEALVCLTFLYLSTCVFGNGHLRSYPVPPQTATGELAHSALSRDSGQTASWMARWRGERLPMGGEGLKMSIDGRPLQDETRKAFALPRQAKHEELEDSESFGRRPIRTIIYDVREHAGLSDRLWVIHSLLAVAHMSKAKLAFPSPDQSLGKHGNATAEWWDSYFAIDPPLLRLEDAECDPSAVPVIVSSEDEVAALANSGTLSRFRQPLCVRFTVGYWDGRMSTAFKDTRERGLEHVRIWTSPFVASLVQRTIAEELLLQGDYNAVHIRLGDKATETCSDAHYVINSMLDSESSFPEYAHEPWLLMSDGDDDFFESMQEEAHARGVTLVTERELPTIQSEPDDFLRYLATLCLYGGSSVALRSAGSCLGATCAPGNSHASIDWIKCNKDQESTD